MCAARRVIAPALAAAAALFGCGKGPAVQKGGPPVDAAPSSPVPDAGFGFMAPDARAADAPGREDGPSCAFESFTGQRLPVDLLVLADASLSMSEKIAGGTRSKWLLAQNALVAFVRDPGSAGLGIGLQFFPLSGNGTQCSTAADCGPSAACEQRKLCLTAGMPPGDAPGCGPLDPLFGCPTGTTCATVGSCAITGVDCSNVGAACPGGVAGDTCQLQPMTCQSAAPVCTDPSYEKLAVPIADLPAGALPFVRTLSMRRPGGATPMKEAVVGALTHLRARGMAMPQRRAALVIATDGVPAGCSNVDVQTVADIVYQGAHDFSPAVPTYVIGVFDQMSIDQGGSALTQLAQAGTTGMPFLLSATNDLTQNLLAALGEIRGQVLPCEYSIPARKQGAIDFGQVNVHFEGPSGAQDVGYVGRAEQCDTTRGGWHYDVDPQAAVPTRVVACPATCRKFKADATGKVELRFGCKSILIE